MRQRSRLHRTADDADQRDHGQQIGQDRQKLEGYLFRGLRLQPELQRLRGAQQNRDAEHPDGEDTREGVPIVAAGSVMTPGPERRRRVPPS